MTPTEISAAQPVIFTTNGPDLPAAVAGVRRGSKVAAGERAWVAEPQNGVVKDDVLRAAFGERVVGAATTFRAQAPDDADEATAEVTGLGNTYLGEFGPSPYDRLSPAWSAFAGDGRR